MARLLTLFSLSSLLILTSCFKTAEELEREKMVDQMKIQVDQSSKVVADLTTQVQMLQEKLLLTSGTAEEQKMAQINIREELTQKLKEQSDVHNEQLETLSSRVNQLEKENEELKKIVSSQKTYIKKVNSTLTGIVEDNQERTPLGEADYQYDKKQYKKAIALYLDEINKKHSKNTVARIYLNLGLSYYRINNHDDSMVFLSKLVTEQPKSSHTHRALYYLGKNFEAKKETKKAIISYKKLIKDFPKSPNVPYAKNNIKRLSK